MENELCKKKTTAPDTSVGADDGQPLHNSTENSISAFEGEINGDFQNSTESLDEIYRRMQRLTDPHHLHTISMTERTRPRIRAGRPLSTACSTRARTSSRVRRRSASHFWWRRSPIMSARAKHCGTTKSIPVRCCTLPWKMIFSASRVVCL